MKNKKRTAVILLSVLCIGGITACGFEKYDSIGEYNRYDLARAEQKGRFGYVNRKKKQVVPVEYEQVEPFTDAALAIVTKDGKKGCVNTKGNLVIPTVYSEIKIGEPNENQMALVSADGEENFVDSNGKTVYESFERLDCDWIMVKEDGKYGCIDDEANTILPCDYKELDVSYFYGESVVVSADGDINFFSTDGEALYDEASEFDDNGWSRVKADGKYGYVDRYGDVVIPAEYTTLEMGKFQSNGYAKFFGDDRLNFVDVNGNLLYQQVGELGENGLAPVQDSEGFWGYINREGTEVIACAYQEAGEFGSNGLAKVKEGRLYGYINELGVQMIQPVYEELGDFGESGVVRAKLGGRSKFIDYFGAKKYDYVSEFKEGAAFARADGKYFFIDENGERLNDRTYDKIAYLNDYAEEEYLLRIGTKYGLANIKGKEIIRVEYDGVKEHYSYTVNSAVNFFSMTGYVMWKNNQYGFTSRDGDFYLEAEYKFIGDVDKEKQQMVLETADNHWEWRTFKNELICSVEGESTGLNDGFLVVKNGNTQDYYGKEGTLLFENGEQFYNESDRCRNDFCVVYKDDQYGVIDQSGNKFLDIAYSELYLYEDMIVFCTPFQTWGIMDYDKNILVEPVCAEITYNEENHTYKVEQLSGKCGYLNSELEFMVPCQFDYAGAFVNECAAVCVEGKWGLINKQGQFLVPPKYDGLRNSSGYRKGNYWEIEDNGKFGVIDTTGKVIIWPSYDSVSLCDKDGIWTVEQGDYSGAFNENGDMIVPLDYYVVIYDKNHDCMIARDMDDILHYFDTSGNEVIPGPGWKSSISEDGLVVTGGEIGYGIYDISGNYIGYQDVELMSRFSQGLAFVRNADYEYGFVDEEGEQVISFEYEDVDMFTQDGFSAVCQDGKWGFINEVGDEIIPCIYDEVEGFYYGRAAVCKNGKWGYINTAGEEVIPLQYDSAESFNRDVATVGNRTEDGLEEMWINYYGEVIE